MTSSLRWIILAAILGLCTSYAMWGRPRTPSVNPSALPSVPATTATGTTDTPAYPPLVRSHGAGALKFDPDEIDFGVVPVNESRSAQQRLINPTDKAIHIRKLFDQGNEAFVLYDLEPNNGQPFRNTEFFTGGGGKIKTIEVYFGSKIGRVEDIK